MSPQKSSKSKYQVGSLVFPSEKIYKIITTIDQELRKLYSSYHFLTLFKTVAYSESRENETQFKSLLNRVEKEIDKLPKKVELEHKDDEVFRRIFHGISCFLDEGKHFSNYRGNYNSISLKV